MLLPSRSLAPVLGRVSSWPPGKPRRLLCTLRQRHTEAKQQWVQRGPLTQSRGAKTKVTIKLKDLPQGLLKEGTGFQEDADNGPAYPTVIQQARNNMRKFEDCVVLTRVGGFYELYFEHAEEYGPLLNLKVAFKGTIAGPVPMAGFPFFQLDRFLKTLVQDLNKYVAISEEFANDAAGKIKSGGLLFNRKVTRIVTPGTLVDEKFMNPYENNFLLAIHADKPIPEGHPAGIDVLTSVETDGKLVGPAAHKIGLAWLDLSTGEFFTQASTVAGLPAGLVRIGAKEIVLNKFMDDHMKSAILEVLGHEHQLVTWQPAPPPDVSVTKWFPMLESSIPSPEQDQFSSEEVTAGNMVLSYVKDKLQGLGIRLQPPVKKEETENMGIDKNSMRGLEILETLRDAITGGKGSLLHTMRRTVTKSGARLLRDRISSPSTSLTVINQRLDLVEYLVNDEPLRQDIVNLLRRTFDSQRLVQKFSLGRGDADDLISLFRTIGASQSIATVLQEAASAQMASNDPRLCSHKSLTALTQRLSLDGPNALASRISEAIDEDGLTATHRIEELESAALVTLAQNVLSQEGTQNDLQAMPQAIRKVATRTSKEIATDEDDVWIMRKNASILLQKLHGDLATLRGEKEVLTGRLRQDTGAASLTLRWTPGLGHICHIRGPKDVRAAMEALNSARNVSSTKSTRSFYIPEWSGLGGKIDQMKLQIKAEEQRVFRELREQVVVNLVKLRRNASVLDELDLACSSAVLASEQGLVRPILNNSTVHKIIAGRHPTVKLGLEEQGRAFVGNDCFVGEGPHIWLITGPNMAGKSTFLRQNALISILAQVGSFVPAEHAEIGIVDKIFSRIGSADDLFQDQSTFMVEMLETAAILKQATPRSFVIMDEVGRGTTPEDGMAVGYACLHHLYHTNRCRALFATHFHALADMTSGWNGLACYCTDVVETASGSFTYAHKLKKGVNRESHALKVARLAGIPDSAVRVAAQVLSSIRERRMESSPGKIDPEKAPRMASTSCS